MEAASTASSGASSVDGPSVGGGGSDYLNLGMFPGAGSVGGSSHQQQSSDLLVGGAGGGFGSSLANGFGNNDSNAALAPGAPTSSSTTGTSFDLSDFPSLGGNSGNATAVGGGGLAAALRQQQLLAQQQIFQGNSGGAGKSGDYRLAMGANGNFTIASEDFPALGGPAGAQPSTASPANANGSTFNAQSLLAGGTNNAPAARTSSGGGGLYGGSELDSVESGAGILGAGLGGIGLRNLQNSNNPAIPRAPTASAPSPPGAVGSSQVGGAGGSGPSAAGTALSGDYGLLGLLGVIRMTDADRNSLALGSDLTMLGLNLGSSEQIYSTFSSPWSDGVTTKEPHFQLPSCYNMQPPALKTGHLSKFQVETLFYIFYALPRDVLQAYAAQELYSREWRYHADSKLWFKRAGPSDGVTNPSGGTQQYLYFDINSWERRLFNGSIQNITSGFLPEEDVRVKFPSS